MNQVTLIGKVVEKYELPYLDIHAIALKCDKNEFIVHMSKNLHDKIDLSKAPFIGVKGHLYHFNCDTYVYADKLFVMGPAGPEIR